MKIGLITAALLASMQVHCEVMLTHVELTTSERAAQPSVVVDSRDGFVVTWQERAAEVNHLKFAAIATDGSIVREGLVASGKDWFVNGADFPNLSVLDNGVTFFGYRRPRRAPTRTRFGRCGRWTRARPGEHQLWFTATLRTLSTVSYRWHQLTVIECAWCGSTGGGWRAKATITKAGLNI